MAQRGGRTGVRAFDGGGRGANLGLASATKGFHASSRICRDEELLIAFFKGQEAQDFHHKTK